MSTIKCSEAWKLDLTVTFSLSTDLDLGHLKFLDLVDDQYYFHFICWAAVIIFRFGFFQETVTFCCFCEHCLPTAALFEFDYKM